MNIRYPIYEGVYRILTDMIAYFRSEKENGQKFCDMVARQVKLYQQKRSQYEVR